METNSTNENKIKDIALIVYVLQAVSLLVGVTLLVAVVLNYIKRSDAHGTWLESHFTWQIRTFWINLGIILIGGISLPIFIGYIILFIGYIYLIFRISKGWMRLAENKPI